MAIGSASLRAKCMLGVLTLVKVHCHLCRYLLYYLYAVNSDDPDKSLTAATGLTAEEYGVLAGTGFTVVYMVTELCMGRAADLYNRVGIIAAGAFIWSGATALMGLSNNFYSLLAARVILGFGAGFTGPSSYSLIADMFPQSACAEANGVYALGNYAGAGLASLALVVGPAIGWRNTCYITSYIGAGLALLWLLLIREPKRVGRERHDSDASEGSAVTVKSVSSIAAPTSAGPSVAGVIVHARRAPAPPLPLRKALQAVFQRRLVLAIILAGSVRYIPGYTLTSYLPTFYSARFPDDTTWYTYLNFAILTFGGAGSAYVGGWGADKWASMGQPRAVLLLPALSAACAIPWLGLALYSPSFGISMGGLLAEYLCAESWVGPAYSALQATLPVRARGIGFGTYSFGASLTGCLALVVVGYLIPDSDDAQHIANVMMASAGTAYAAAALLFCVAASLVPKNGPDYDEIVDNLNV